MSDDLLYCMWNNSWYFISGGCKGKVRPYPRLKNAPELVVRDTPQKGPRPGCKEWANSAQSLPVTIPERIAGALSISRMTVDLSFNLYDLTIINYKDWICEEL